MTNTELQHAVRKELAFDPKVDSAEIAVSAENGTVTLRGTTHTLREKMEARRAAERVPGVVVVDDQLEARILEGREDNELRGAVLQALMLDGLVPSTIDVVATHGVITLKGTADQRLQRDEAVAVTSRVPGVSAVLDEITLPVATPDIFEVKDTITRAFERDARRDAGSVDVMTTDGIVTLSGAVRSWTEHDAAVAAAWATPGVREVVDQIVVTSEMS